jgi:hypothetical protein
VAGSFQGILIAILCNLICWNWLRSVVRSRSHRLDLIDRRETLWTPRHQKQRQSLVPFPQLFLVFLSMAYRVPDIQGKSAHSLMMLGRPVEM